jgi:hypothetical protein
MALLLAPKLMDAAIKEEQALARGEGGVVPSTNIINFPLAR